MAVFKPTPLQKSVFYPGYFSLVDAAATDDKKNWLIVDTDNSLNFYDIGDDSSINKGLRHIIGGSFPDRPRSTTVFDGGVYAISKNYLLALEIDNQSYAWSNWDPQYTQDSLPGIKLGDNPLYSICIVGDFIYVIDGKGNLHKVSIKYGPAQEMEGLYQPKQANVLYSSAFTLASIKMAHPPIIPHGYDPDYKALFSNGKSLFFIEWKGNKFNLVSINPDTLEANWRVPLPSYIGKYFNDITFNDHGDLIIAATKSVTIVNSNPSQPNGGGTFHRIDTQMNLQGLEKELYNGSPSARYAYGFLSAIQVPGTDTYVAKIGKADIGDSLSTGFFAWELQDYNTPHFKWARNNNPIMQAYEDLYKQNIEAIHAYKSKHEEVRKTLGSSFNLSFWKNLIGCSNLIPGQFFGKNDQYIEGPNSVSAVSVQLMIRFMKEFGFSAHVLTGADLNNLGNSLRQKFSNPDIQDYITGFPGSHYGELVLSQGTINAVWTFLQLSGAIIKLSPFFKGLYNLMEQAKDVISTYSYRDAMDSGVTYFTADNQNYAPYSFFDKPTLFETLYHEFTIGSNSQIKPISNDAIMVQTLGGLIGKADLSTGEIDSLWRIEEDCLVGTFIPYKSEKLYVAQYDLISEDGAQSGLTYYPLSF